jgi:putative Ig domain-containing protein
LRRFLFALLAAGVVAVIATATAAALRFNDDAYIWADGEVGTPYFKQINASAGCPPYKFRVLAGTLPDGLSLASDGKVTGTPQRLGQWNFWLELRGAGCPNDKPAEREFSASVTRIKVTVQTNTLADAVRGAPYPTQNLQVIGGTGTGYTWSTEGSLPAGLTLNANGTISGTPTANGVSIFTVKATDSAGRSDTKQLSINVVDPLAAAASLSVAEVGVPFRTSVNLSGGTPEYTMTTAGLPPGLSVDPTGRAISGTPEAAGSFALQVSITDSRGLRATRTVTLKVVEHLAIATRSLRAASAGRAYTVRVRLTGGARPFKWTARGLPRGLKLGAGGVLTGSPAAAGTYRLQLRVRDVLGATSSRTLTLAVL